MMDRKWLNFLYDAAMFIILAVIITICLLCLFSCSPKVITVPEYHYEMHNATDTLILRDSVYHENNTVISEADSTMLAEFGIRLRNGERAILVLRSQLERALSQQKEVKTDTVIKIDTIRVAYPVEKQLSRWQKLKMDAGGYAVFALIVAIVIIFIRNKKP